MSEPTTEAGRALWEAYGGTTASAAILAIEREAYAKVRAAVGVEFIEAMRDMARTEALVIVENRVLAAIDTLMGDDDGR